MVSEYGMGYRAIKVRSPAEASMSRPALGVKRGRCVTLTTHPPPHLVPRS
jgi:hypothetical protein